MVKIENLEIDIVLNAKKAPGRDISTNKLVRTLEDIINSALQARFPEFNVEVRSMKANWPGAPENFSEYDLEKQK